MNTQQNYVGKGDSATTPPQMAQNADPTSSTPNERTTIEKATSSNVELPLSIWQPKGYQSDVEVIYWALEAQKQLNLSAAEKSTGPGADDFETSFYEVSRIQEIQNTLFGLVCDLTSTLSKQANEGDHE